MRGFKKSLMSLLMFGVLCFGGCEFLKWKSTENVRNICNKYEVGTDISAATLAEEIRRSKIRLSRIYVGTKESTFYKENPELLQEIDRTGARAQASITVAVGFPKFTCSLSFDQKKVTHSSTRWWD